MRRWLIVVLLVLLPTQFSWAAAASYCRHEGGSSARHIGHHDHKHQAGKPNAGQDDRAGANASAGQLDDDCGVCQLSVVQPVVPTHAVVFAASSQLFTPLELRLFESHIADMSPRPVRALDR